MSVIWNKLIQSQEDIINIFEEQAKEIQEPGMDHFNQPDGGWVNRVWANDNIRRAHIDVVDARESKGLWMMHVCCFPVLNNDGPIYGFRLTATHTMSKLDDATLQPVPQYFPKDNGLYHEYNWKLWANAAGIKTKTHGMSKSAALKYINIIKDQEGKDSYPGIENRKWSHR